MNGICVWLFRDVNCVGLMDIKVVCGFYCLFGGKDWICEVFICLFGGGVGWVLFFMLFGDGDDIIFLLIVGCFFILLDVVVFLGLFVFVKVLFIILVYVVYCFGV